MGANMTTATDFLCTDLITHRYVWQQHGWLSPKWSTLLLSLLFRVPKLVPVKQRWRPLHFVCSSFVEEGKNCQVQQIFFSTQNRKERVSTPTTMSTNISVQVIAKHKWIKQIYTPLLLFFFFFFGFFLFRVFFPWKKSGKQLASKLQGEESLSSGVKELLHNGQIFTGNLSKHLECETNADPWPGLWDSSITCLANRASQDLLHLGKSRKLARLVVLPQRVLIVCLFLLSCRRIHPGCVSSHAFMLLDSYPRSNDTSCPGRGLVALRINLSFVLPIFKPSGSNRRGGQSFLGWIGHPKNTQNLAYHPCCHHCLSRGIFSLYVFARETPIEYQSFFGQRKGILVLQMWHNSRNQRDDSGGIQQQSRKNATHHLSSFLFFVLWSFSWG